MQSSLPSLVNSNKRGYESHNGTHSSNYSNSSSNNQYPYSTHHNNSNNSNNNSNNDQNPHHKKAKYNPARNQSTLETVVDYIFALPTLNQVALEFRCGRKSPAGFTSFMTHEDFQAIMQFIKKVAKRAAPYSEYIYERGRYLHSKLTANEAGMVTSGVYKEKLATFDMETNHELHNVRIDIMKESPIVPIPVCPEEGYMFCRKKLKYTLETKDWTIDLFHVTTTQAEDKEASEEYNEEGEGEDGTNMSNSKGVESFELEAQVKISSIRNVPDKKACVELLDNIFVEIHNLLARLAVNGAQVFPDLKLERVSRQDHYHYLKNQFLQTVPNISANNHRFPGSLPSGLERNKIKFLQKGDYWVSEKSDGLRYLLFIVDKAAFLVDRRMDFYQIHKFPALIDLFGANGVTLLDGEMVRNLRTGKLMFLIFDILALNGQTNLGMYNLSERLGIIGKKVVTVFRDAIKEKGKDYAMKLQFTLSGKIFRPKHLIKELATMIKHNEKGERLFVDDKRCHRNDGLIFTPSGPYMPYSSSHLMKWKYCDRLTIDFLFKFTPEGHVALVGKGGDVMVDWQGFDLIPEDWNKLTAALAKTVDPSKAVIECAYDNQVDKWKFLCLRPDKDRPNHITTVQHTLFIVKENITLEELVYRVPIKTEADKWEQLHPELFKSNEASTASPSSESDSPTVDLPSTPLPSPIACKSTPPSFDEAFSP